MAKTITLGDKTFAKKEAAMGYLSDKMESYAIDAPIPDADIELWFEVLQKHEWFQEYVDFGIQHFAVTWSTQRPNYRNMIVVNDRGEKKPFSYHKYLSRGPLSKLAKVKAALRTEVDPQIIDYRTKRFAGGPTVLSAISDKPLTERRCEVHHSVKPFLQLIDEFLLSNVHQWPEMETEAAGATGYRLRDRAIATDWIDFHRTHATLEIVSPEENRQLGTSGYRMSFTAL
ncbi:DUF3223 domain-containing protein [Bradyrhizobium sp. 48]|uniref:DUF3223 domain-containing protein n=1 Tax=Bradyrhizobium sp. 48 TaxID=2782676 RepID=UPI001FF95CCD|nr:DUF3223 domain-containing protein [Bradyrhizobium sp. 48]MCK1443404.1 DUF3223 domain-containing protein [Bradyrhizobium sp. 48]